MPFIFPRYQSRRRRRSYQPDTTDLQLELVAAASLASPVESWTNTGEAGNTFDDGGSTQEPTVSSINGCPSLLFDDSNDRLVYTTGSVADWTFMHDGTGCTIAIVFRCATSGGGEGGTLLDSVRPLATRQGFYMAWDDANERIQVQVGDSSGTFIVSQYTSNGSAPAGATVIVVVRIDEARTNGQVDIRVNGVQEYYGDFGGDTTPATTAPSNYLTIGSWANGGNPYGGHIHHVLAWDRTFTASECRALERGLSNRWRATGLHETVTFMLAGQSNASANLRYSESAPSGVNGADLVTWNGSAWITGANETGANLGAPGMGVLGGQIGRNLLDRLPGECRVLAGCANATPIADFRKGQTAYDDLLADINDSGAEPSDLIWAQGEDNAGDNQATHYAQLDAWRGEWLADVPSLQRIIILKTRDGACSGDVSGVRAAEEQLAATYDYVYIVDAEALITAEGLDPDDYVQEDDCHWKVAGYVKEAGYVLPWMAT